MCVCVWLSVCAYKKRTQVPRCLQGHLTKNKNTWIEFSFYCLLFSFYCPKKICHHIKMIYSFAKQSLSWSAITEMPLTDWMRWSSLPAFYDWWYDCSAPLIRLWLVIFRQTVKLRGYARNLKGPYYVPCCDVHWPSQAIPKWIRDVTHWFTDPSQF